MLTRYFLAPLMGLCLVLGISLAAAQEPVVKVIEPWSRADKPLDTVPDLKTITLVAPRNGFASGVVAIQAAAEIPGVTARMSDLQGPGGAVLPAARVQVRYGAAAGSVYGLDDAPLKAAAAKQAVWVRATVPETATPGAYTGTLTITGLAAPVAVPVSLTVYNWRVGNPNEWTTWTGYLQSPESVAGYYKVPMWSDAHFKLLERSMQLMAECGNDYLGIQAVGPSYWGDDPVVVFRKAGDTYTPDFTYLERYLDMYNRIVGKPSFLAVQVWSFPQRGGVESGTQPVLIHVLDGDKLVRTESPCFGAPGTEAMWKATLEGIRERVTRLGWDPDRILLGTSGDSMPIAGTIDFFKKIAPWANWRVLTHGTGCPKWGLTSFKRTQPNGMLVGYLEIARWVGNGRPHVPGSPVVSNSRDHIGTEPFALFALAPFSAKGRYEGFCNKGLDYWTYTTANGQTRNALNSYMVFGNVIGGTPRALSFPGPDGAMRSPETEMVREGIEAQEAVYRIQDNLEILNPAPVKQCDMAEIFLQQALRGAQDSAERARELEVSFIFDGNNVIVKPNAPTWNTGARSGVAKSAQLTKDGAKFSFDVTIKDDPWVAGGEGHFEVEVALKDGLYTGTFKGQFKGVETQGTVRGSFQPKSVTLQDGPAPAKTELQTRCEAAIKDFHDALNLDARPASPLRANLRALLTRIHALAEETTLAVAAKKR